MKRTLRYPRTICCLVVITGCVLGIFIMPMPGVEVGAAQFSGDNPFGHPSEIFPTSTATDSDLNAALTALKKAHRLNPNYREVAGLIAEIENKLQQQPPAGFASSVQDSLYQIGLAAFNRGDWVQAVIAFEKAQLLQPDYRDVADRLAQARDKLRRLEKNDLGPNVTNDSATLFFFGGVLAALIVMPLAGAFIFSPAARARLHLLRGDYMAATKVYENFLARHPARLKFYPVLANLYLLQSRRDERAMKIYKAILHFNLATPHREELSIIVAQKYLTEGRTDSDAIEVLEHALQVEQRRQLHE